MSVSKELFQHLNYVREAQDSHSFRSAVSILGRDLVGYSGQDVEQDDLRCVYEDDGTIREVFPHPRDYDALFDRAFDVASSPVDNRAMTHGAAIIAIHAEGDGNGRLSRAVHALHAGKTNDEIIEMGIIDSHAVEASDTRARSLINLAMPQQLDDFIESEIYKETGVKKQQISVTGVPQIMSLRDLYLTIPADNFDDLTTIKNGVDQTYRANSRSLVFALSALVADGHEVPRIESDVEAEPGVDMQKLLKSLGYRGVHNLFSDIWDFRRLRADIGIQSTSPNTKRGKTIISIAGEEMPVADHFVCLTNNLIC